MMATKTKPAPLIARNLAWSSIGQLVTWSLGIGIAVYLPRRLGAEAVGTLYFAQALWLIGAALATFGTDQLLIKQVANKELAPAAAAQRSAVARAGLLLIVWPIMGLFLVVGGYGTQAILACAAIGAAASVTAVGASWRSALVGREQLGVVSLIDVLVKVALVVALVVIARQTRTIEVVALSWLPAAVVGAFCFAVATGRQKSSGVQAVRGNTRSTIRAGGPFLLLSGSVLLYHQIDIIVVSQVADASATGWYGAADQLYGSAFFLTTVFFAALGPAMFRLGSQSPAARRVLMNDGLQLVSAAAVALGLGLAMVGDSVAVLVFGNEFEPAGAVIRLLGLALIPSYVATFMGFVALTSGGAVRWAQIMIGATVATIALDVVLVPLAHRRWDNGAIGGALSYIVTEVLIVLVGLWLYRDLFGGRQFAWSLTRQIGAGLIMVGALTQFETAPLAFRIAIGAIVYIFSIRVFHGVNTRQLRLAHGALPMSWRRNVIDQETKSERTEDHDANS